MTIPVLDGMPKKIAWRLTFLGRNILPQIGILMGPGDGKVEARITLGHRGHLYRAVRFWENSSRFSREVKTPISEIGECCTVPPHEIC